MNLSTRLTVGFISLCMPLAAAAAAPGSVTGIQASLQGGRVLVTWTPLPASDNIVAYRVFFGHQSILSSNGLYDDYDTVDGSVNSYALVNTPASDVVYVSVLAMNADGEESPYFAEEASLKLRDNGQTPVPPVQTSSAAASMQTESAMPSMPTSTMTQTSNTVETPLVESPLRLLSVVALSATGVELTFSQTVTIDPSVAAQSFQIRSGSGKELPLTRLSIQGNIVRIDTAPQERGTVYALIPGAGISGIDTERGTITLMDPAQAPMLFSGHANGITPATDTVSSSSSSSAPATLPSGSDVTGLVLRATEEKKGMYAIQATWQAPNDPMLTGFSVTQSTDGGRTYGQPHNLSATTNTVTIPHVPGGKYGIMVRVVYANGTMSQGVQKSVELAGGPATNLPGNVISKPPVTNLPQSGPGVWAVVLTLGSALGYAAVKRFGNVDMKQA